MKIKTIKVGIPQQDCNELFIRIPYEFDSKTAQAYWEARNENSQSVANGNVDIDEKIMASWGVDDKPIEDFILSKLNLTRA